MVKFDKDKISLPIIVGGIVGTAVNVLCCLGSLAGGIVAVYLYKKNGGFINYENSAFIGCLAGLFGGFLGGILNYIIAMSKIIHSDMFMYGFAAGFFIIGIIFSIIIGGILGAVGGVIYAVIKNR